MQGPGARWGRRMATARSLCFRRLARHRRRGCRTIFLKRCVRVHVMVLLMSSSATCSTSLRETDAPDLRISRAMRCRPSRSRASARPTCRGCPAPAGGALPRPPPGTRSQPGCRRKRVRSETMETPACFRSFHREPDRASRPFPKSSEEGVTVSGCWECLEQTNQSSQACRGLKRAGGNGGIGMGSSPRQIPSPSRAQTVQRASCRAGSGRSPGSVETRGETILLLLLGSLRADLGMAEHDFRRRTIGFIGRPPFQAHLLGVRLPRA